MTAQNDILQRGNCFKLLAACFYEPDKALFSEERVCGNLQDLLKIWASGAAEAASDMDLGLSMCSQDQLSLDHAALFVGPFELLAPPYGSIYREKNRQVMGESTIEVQRCYEDAGLALDIKEAPDHIAIELEFMYYLCAQEAAALANGRHQDGEKHHLMMKSFFQTALQWIPLFCESIRKGTKNPFYTSLADCLDRFMISCKQFYPETVKTVT